MAIRNRTARTAALVLGLAFSASALAHHSFAVFFSDEKAVVTVRGKVTGFEFKNPHGLIRLVAKDANGAEVPWKAETNSPSILERRGWTRTSLKVGDEIAIEGWLARDGSRYMRMRKVTRGDGTPIGVPFDHAEQK